jgi:hypothetical protein
MKLQIHTGALLVATLGMIGTSFGAGAPAVPDSLRACASKQDVLQRLSCFDAEMSKLEGQPAATAAPAPAAARAPAAAAPPSAPAPRPSAATPPPQPATLGSEQLRNAPGVPLGEEQLRKPAKPSSSSSLASSLKFWKSDKEKEKEADDGMTARIDSIKSTLQGLYVVSLDNGQVWRQQEYEADFPLEAGETIRIDKGAMGSYKLKPVREGWKRWIRVTRTK